MYALDMFLRFSVSKADGTTFDGDDVWLPTSFLFKSTARLAHASGLFFSPADAVTRYENVYGARTQHGDTVTVGQMEQRIVYVGPVTSCLGIAVRSGSTLGDVRNEHRARELERQSVTTQRCVSRESTFVFDTIAAGFSQSATHLSELFCGMLDDTYTEALLVAESDSDDALNKACSAYAVSVAYPHSTNASAALDAARRSAIASSYVQHVRKNITSSKGAVASRVLSLFPESEVTIDAANRVDASAIDTQHVVISGCFDSIERGLCANAMSRGPIGPDCPVCFENIDSRDEASPRSLIILACLLPRDFRNGAMHHMCRGCWASVKHHAFKSGTAPRCPMCRTVTAGRTLSSCAYNVMIDLTIDGPTID